MKDLDINKLNFYTQEEVWVTLPKFIDWLIKNRKTKKYNYQINLNIIFNSTCIIEGFIFQIIHEFLGELNEDNSTNYRIFKDFQKKIENANWTQINEYFKVVTNFKLNEFTDNECWKAITILFQLRNQLIHGKFAEVHFEPQKKEQISVKKNYGKIFEYLKEKQLVNESSFSNFSGVSLVNNETTDYFYNNCKIFLSDINNHFVKNNDLEIVEESFEIAFG